MKGADPKDQKKAYCLYSALLIDKGKVAEAKDILKKLMKMDFSLVS